MGAEVFRYTKAAEDITADGQDWNATPIRRDNLTLSSEDREQARSFQVPGDNAFASNFILSAPSEVPVIEVFEVHFGDVSDVKRRWAGEVTDLNWVDHAAWVSITARPIEGGLDARFPRIDDGVLCPYMLYDAFCKVAEAAFTFAGTASSVSGATMVVSGLDASKGVGWAKGGKIRVVSTQEVRAVIKHVATDTLTLSSPFKESPNGLAVQVLAGCDRTLATCDSKFNNVPNFGGAPFIPTKDPNERIT
jgi:uncharacterized phage protein (TIGR02218 family)